MMKQIDIMDFQEPEEFSSGFGDAEKQMEQAKQAGLKYVASRMRTCREVGEYLQKKGYDHEVAQAVIAFLEAYHYLDDAAYCKSWIHDRMEFHPCGRQKMAMELAKKITDRALVRASLEEYFTEEAELELAMAAALKKIGSGRTAIKRDQLARFLYTKGFGSVVVNRVLQEDTVRERLCRKNRMEPDMPEEDW